MEIDVPRQDITWVSRGQQQHLKLLPGRIYIHPSGYKIRMTKHQAAPSWRLVGAVPEGAFCHKPCTVSGGGKSEISKSLVDAVLPGSFHVPSFEDDMAAVQAIFDRSYDDIAARSCSPDRSLGSVIKLLTPNPAEFTPEYNAWLESIPNHVRALVFVIKRFHRPEWGDDWRRHFSVDIINGAPGHELKYEGRRLVASYLRIGREENGAWRTYKLRQDFVAADKVQMEDDITASVVVPARRLVGLPGRVRRPPEPEAGAELRVPALPAPRRRHPSRASTGRPRRTWRAPGSSARISSRSRGRTRSASSRTWRSTTPSRQPMREHVAANAARPDGGYSICSAAAATRRRQADQEPALPSGAAGPRATPRPVRRGDGRAALPAAAAARAGAVPGDQRALGPPQQPARRRHPPALRVRPHPLPGAARALHGLRVLADGHVAEHHGRGLGGRAHEGPVQRARGRRPISTTRWSPCCSPATRASAPPRASSGRATGWITTSAC